MPFECPDIELVLFIDLIITGSHMALPIRWCMLVPVQLSGVLIYAAASLFVERNSKPLQPLVFIAVLTFCASFGKRNLERQERQEFRSFMAEKVLRLQMEFKLSKVGPPGDGALVEDQQSMRSIATGSAPSTTESGRAFACDETNEPSDELGQAALGFLPAICEYGQKEQWLISPGQVELQPQRVLGEGSFGHVIHGRFCGVPAAVK